MKRSGVTLDEIADWRTLTEAAYRAARGKRHRLDVQDFFRNLPENLARMSVQIRQGTISLGRMKRFKIYDPKPRIIHAPCFRERVVHHALMAHIGPVLDKGLVYDTYACRVGKGTLAAVHRAQQHVRRFPWYAKIDIRAYFASINHSQLKAKLHSRFKCPRMLAFIERIIDSHEEATGKGLPIGTLTSQHFANFYLNGLDRYLLERCRVAGMVRYMDDVVWWHHDCQQVRETLRAAEEYVRGELDLTIKTPVQINRSVRGLSMCGFRILPGTLRLSRRRRIRYAQIRCNWERAFSNGLINARVLQSGYSSALAITSHADAATWRREQLRMHPPEENCLCV